MSPFFFEKVPSLMPCATLAVLRERGILGGPDQLEVLVEEDVVREGGDDEHELAGVQLEVVHEDRAGHALQALEVLELAAVRADHVDVLLAADDELRVLGQVVGVEAERELAEDRLPLGLGAGAGSRGVPVDAVVPVGLQLEVRVLDAEQVLAADEHERAGHHDVVQLESDWVRRGYRGGLTCCRSRAGRPGSGCRGCPRPARSRRTCCGRRGPGCRLSPRS